VLHGFEMVAGFWILVIQRKDRFAAAPLAGLSAVPFIRKEMLKAGKKKTSEAADPRSDVSDVILLQQAREKALRQVFGLGRVVSAAPNVGVKRIPIGLAEFGQSLLELGRVFFAHGQNGAPMRGAKLRRRFPRWGHCP